MSEERSNNFLEDIIEQDIAEGKFGGRVHTRFPPEPNGYLHIGHAKSICLNFGLARRHNGLCNLRFDDTNPVKEKADYVSSIKEDIKWLGFDWAEEHYASDYFEQLYQYALQLIKAGHAYVDDASAEEIARRKGSPTEAGTESPCRNRSVEENLDLFTRMRNGEFAEGEKVLRAKIDMANPNMHLRDPLMYRIKFAHHHRTGDNWCIYPMYDFAHGQSDSIEEVTHSVCTLEFVVHRPLYNWFIEKLDIFPSRQYEFARLNLTYTVMSKRKLLQLIEDKVVEGWDDPRMPTISAFRRRGYTAASIRDFCEKVGVQRRDNMIDLSLLEFCIREDLNKTAPRVMAVLDPVKMVITNYPENTIEEVATDNNPEDPAAGSRKLPFGRELYIERDDFMEDPPKKFFRLAVGKMVRLKSAYIVQCDDFEKDEAGNIKTIFCSYIPESRSSNDTSGLKVKGTIHWLSAAHAGRAEVRLYDRLFLTEDPAGAGRELKELINPDSLEVIADALIEPSLTKAKPGDRFQFMRKGYFCVDRDSAGGKLVFNRTVTLRDTWAKVAAKAN